MNSMGALKYSVVSLATYCVVGPLVPTFFLLLPNSLTGSEVALFAAFFVPSAYLLGGLFALLCGATFTTLTLLAVRLLGGRSLNRGGYGVMGGALGSIAALPWLFFLPSQLWTFFFLAPSSACGAVLGCAVLQRLAASQLLRSDTPKVRAG